MVVLIAALLVVACKTNRVVVKSLHCLCNSFKFISERQEDRHWLADRRGLQLSGPLELRVVL